LSGSENVSSTPQERGPCDFCGLRRVLHPTRYHDDGLRMYACRECADSIAYNEDPALQLVEGGDDA
jgi:hypothetical protein